MTASLSEWDWALAKMDQLEAQLAARTASEARLRGAIEAWADYMNTPWQERPDGTDIANNLIAIAAEPPDAAVAAWQALVEALEAREKMLRYVYRDGQEPEAEGAVSAAYRAWKGER